MRATLILCAAILAGCDSIPIDQESDRGVCAEAGRGSRTADEEQEKRSLDCSPHWAAEAQRQQMMINNHIGTRSLNCGTMGACR
ncbi:MULTISPECIES: hypothetical protein [Ramlibacter]|uniref:Lipoprotein n=1 Tax=Ramlibacter pinisoli TaxID=2682844 RepID=A0A6N8IQD3_9BURK|nr:MULTISPECIES: hypothetical protein [Ramlibacter]MBA2963799.1 hypothetical protein [Ramlibacter sp. CGMCC 1.13660]MVQ28765.1 hypothetical protein [Ramlibacter pinisoli]